MTFKMELTKKYELEFTFHLKNLQRKYIVRTTIDLQNCFNSDAWSQGVKNPDEDNICREYMSNYIIILNVRFVTTLLKES